MDLPASALLAQSFLTEHLRDTPPDAPRVRVRDVVPEGDALRCTFLVDEPMTMADRRFVRRVNASLSALLAAHPALAAIPLDVTVDVDEG